MSTPSDRLRAARTKAGFASATEAAKAFGWTVSTYLGHENGSRGLPVDAAQRYGRAFRVPWEYLLSGEAGARSAADYGTPIMGALGVVIPSLPEREAAELLPVGAEGYDFNELVAYAIQYGRHNHYLIAAVAGEQPLFVGDEIIVSTVADGGRMFSSWFLSEDQKGTAQYVQNFGPRAHHERLMAADEFHRLPGVMLEGVVVAEYIDKRRRKVIETASFR